MVRGSPSVIFADRAEAGRALAEDALELVNLDYEELGPVVDSIAAAAGAKQGEAGCRSPCR